MSTKRAIFLDRDGVIIEDVHHISKPEDARLIPHSAEAVKRLNISGYKTIIITNQAAVGIGICTEMEALNVNQRVLELLLEKDAIIDATYMCFHHPTKGIGEYLIDCECRKPKPGMILRAIKEQGIENISESYLIGDKCSDISAGLSSGLKTILVQTGHGGKDKGAMPHYLTNDLYSAVDLILGDNR